MAIPVSFEGVESVEFKPLPTGRYPATVTNLEYIAESKRSGQPALSWEFTVSSGDYQDRKGFLNTSLQEQALWSTLRILMALGFSDEEIKGRDWDFEDPEVIDAIVNRECVMLIGHEKFDGEMQQRVRRILSAAGEEMGATPF